MSTAKYSEHRRFLLSDSGLGVDVTVLLDESNIGVGPQILELRRGESTRKAVDDIPLVGDRGDTADPTREGANTGFTVNAIFEGDDISSGNGLLDLLHLNEGGRSGETGENTESEDEEILGEHVGNAE